MLEIITNNQYRDIVSFYELPENEQTEMVDHFCEDKEHAENSSYFRYKKQVYSLDDFMRIENHPDKEFSGYHGYHGDSYFSGILIKISDCGESVIVATYFS